MKKHFTLYRTGWALIVFETVLSAVGFLSVFMVNGADAITSDHIALLFLFILTIASIFCMRYGKSSYKKAVLWMAVLPLMFVSYEVSASFFVHSQTQVATTSANQMLFVLTNPVR